MKSVTCTAPVNIAVIKYWGKRDEKLILPVNSSLSVTLGQDELRAKTTVATSKEFTKDRIWLNGKEETVATERLQNIFREIKRRARRRKADSKAEDAVVSWKVHICSENNFPTAAGLASSAAGYACLVYSLAKLFGVEGEISDIARQGSGSACRSVYGGFVEWEKGVKEDGTDSLAKQVAPETHWPEMKVLILVVSDHKKHTSSTAGMQTTVKTSQLLQYRAEHIVPQRSQEITQAILDKNFPKFAEITMKDSNQFHAVCLDTYPPISYMRDVSQQIVRLVHAYNKLCGQARVCYTFDAGPNACLFLLEEDVPRVVSLVSHFFPPAVGDESNFVRGIPLIPDTPSQVDVEGIPLEPQPGAIKYVIHTKVGGSPQALTNPKESLLGEDGLPLHIVKS
ncbi:diphosphomevalonate decarboxylase-like [Liolophura sinensis]|uniref:diphosphomevalonate decarboxylase-like n=1 Tax=Liolophura sinensis TaxID=3198878 RepID=UPI0031587651